MPWADLTIGQVVKQYVGKRVVGMTRRLVQGTSATALRLMAQPPGCLVLNTAYIERLNGTFRARLAPLARRTHHLVHRKELLHAGMYLIGALYNVCTVHASLTLASGQRQTPAMAVGITDHCLSPGTALTQGPTVILGAAENSAGGVPGPCNNLSSAGLPHDHG